MTQIKQSNTGEVTRPEAKNMIDQIKQLLRTTGTNEFLWKRSNSLRGLFGVITMAILRNR